MFFRAGRSLSRYRCTTQCVPCIVQSYHRRKLRSWRPDPQPPSSFIGEQSENCRRSRSSTLKLPYFVPLEKLFVVKRLEADVAKLSVQIAKELQSQQTHGMIPGQRELPSSSIHFSLGHH